MIVRRKTMLKIKNEYSEHVTKTFRIPTEIIKQLDDLATKHNTSVNKVVIQCLEYALDNLDENIEHSKKEQT